MAGLILLVALAAFITLLVFLSRLATQSLAISVEAKTGLRWLIVVGAFPLMLTDELVGMYQFNALCKANGIESADVSKARGKRVNIHDDYFEWHAISGQILPTEETETQIKDAETHDVLARFKNYRTKGGWLMRYTPLSMGSLKSMLFDSSTCDWTVTMEVMKHNDITWNKN